MIETRSGLLQAAWGYIYSWPLPILAKTYSSVSGNGTKINRYNQRAVALANVSSGATAPAGGVTPNHDTLYAQAILDLSQVAVVAHVVCLHLTRQSNMD